MALFKSPAEKAKAKLQSSQDSARRKAIKDEMSAAEGSFNENIKNSKEAERKAQQEYEAALRTGDEEKIKGAIENMAKAEEATKQAKQEKTTELSKMKQSYKGVGKPEQPETQADTNKPAGISKPAEQTTGISKPAEQPDQSADTSKPANSGSNPVKDTVQGSRLSASFYRDLSAGLKNRPGGNIADTKAATAGAQAQVAQNAAAKRGMEAQQHQQIANQNAFAEAGKIASVQNGAENRQHVANAGAAAGNAAARLRKTNTPDVQSQLARQDQQRNVASTQREKEDEMEGEVVANTGLEKEREVVSRDFDNFIDTSERLSMGEGAKEEPVETAKSEPKKPAEPTAPVEPQLADLDWRSAYNYMTYANDPKSRWYKGGGKDATIGKEALDKVNQATGQNFTPLSEADGNGFTDEGFLEEKLKSNSPEFYRLWANQTDETRGRASGKTRNIGEGGLTDEQYQQNAQQRNVMLRNTDDIESDTRVKNVQKALSDCRMKYILDDYNSGRGITPDDFMWLAKQMGGKFTHNDREYDFFNDDDWNDDSDGSVLKGYAEHIRNYLYTYKPEATEIDSSIDPDEEHIGPMAQDIEMVNPACVKETPEGAKTVDTARLAMMNAGAIGDLARQMQELTDKLKELGL